MFLAPPLAPPALLSLFAILHEHIHPLPVLSLPVTQRHSSEWWVGEEEPAAGKVVLFTVWVSRAPDGGRPYN